MPENRPAKAVRTSKGYQCSRCGTPAWYDGRMGDGPVLQCRCAEADNGGFTDPDDYWKYGNRD